MNNDEKILLTTDEGEEIAFEVLEETKLGGIHYLLVTDAEEEDEEGECYVLKDTSGEDSSEAVYEFVEDENELDALFQIFTELMSDEDTSIMK